jgi:hypothetical protein
MYTSSIGNTLAGGTSKKITPYSGFRLEVVLLQVVPFPSQPFFRLSVQSTLYRTLLERMAGVTTQSSRIQGVWNWWPSYWAWRVPIVSASPSPPSETKLEVYNYTLCRLLFCICNTWWNPAQFEYSALQAGCPCAKLKSGIHCNCNNAKKKCHSALHVDNLAKLCTARPYHASFEACAMLLQSLISRAGG